MATLMQRVIPRSGRDPPGGVAGETMDSDERELEEMNNRERYWLKVKRSG